MKRRCQSDFHCTFQKWLGSCRCSPYARASQKPGGQAECSISDVRFSYTEAPVEKWAENDSDMCTWCMLHPGIVLLPSRAVTASAATLILLSSTSVDHFRPHGQLLGHLAGVRKLLTAFFHWKATRGLGVREGSLFIWFCLCTKDRKREREKRVKHKVCSSRLVCVLYLYLCVCVCVFGREDWAGVRDSDGVERVWCTVITLSGMWLSWELLALGTWANKLPFKGQLPSLYRLLFFPTLCSPHPVGLYLF